MSPETSLSKHEMAPSVPLSCKDGRQNRKRTVWLLSGALFLALFLLFLSLCTGRYPLTPGALLRDEGTARRVFLTLRLPRTLLAALAGFALGVAGFIYQIIFRNPLAAPDIIGVSSGSCAGAAAAILLLHGSAAVISLCAFIGGILAVCLALGLSALSRRPALTSMVLAGIAVNALAQSVLMILKYLADPEKELASIEYWTMGSFAGVTASRLPTVFLVVLPCLLILFLLYRKLLTLSLEEAEARMLGVPVTLLRLLALGMATLITSAIVSVTGVISFAGLLAPHGARLLQKNSQRSTLLLSGLLGCDLLLAADVIARSASSGELPVSITTSLLGAPLLLWLIMKGGRTWD